MPLRPELIVRRQDAAHRETAAPVGATVVGRNYLWFAGNLLDGTETRWDDLTLSDRADGAGAYVHPF